MFKLVIFYETNLLLLCVIVISDNGLNFLTHYIYF